MAIGGTGSVLPYGGKRSPHRSTVYLFPTTACLTKEWSC